MFKTLTAGLTALSLIIIPAAPVQAQNNNDDLNRAIIGLLAVGAIGLAIKNNQDKRDRSSETREQRPSIQVHNNHGQHNNNRVREQRRVDLIPGRCFRRVETSRGGYQGVFTERCLDRRYRDANTLPGQCRVRIGGSDGNRRGYDASCLRDFGYRTDRRWN